MWLQENLLAVGVFGLCTALVQVWRAAPVEPRPVRGGVFGGGQELSMSEVEEAQPGHLCEDPGHFQPCSCSPCPVGGAHRAAQSRGRAGSPGPDHRSSWGPAPLALAPWSPECLHPGG